jgi:hypothetical protein
MLSLTSSPRITSSEIDLEAQQAEFASQFVEIAQAAARAGAFFPFLITVEVVTARKEDVEGAETNETDIPGPHINSVASPLDLVYTGQDTNDNAQSVVSHAGGATSIWPCCRIPK